MVCIDVSNLAGIFIAKCVISDMGCVCCVFALFYSKYCDVVKVYYK